MTYALLIIVIEALACAVIYIRSRGKSEEIGSLKKQLDQIGGDFARFKRRTKDVIDEYEKELDSLYASGGDVGADELNRMLLEQETRFEKLRELRRDTKNSTGS